MMSEKDVEHGPAITYLSRRQLLKAAAAGVGAFGAAGSVVPLHQARLASAAQEPTRGGIIKVAQEQDPVSLDPYRNSNFSSVQQFDLIYNALVRFDDKLNIVPDLAESWETPDPTTYVFRLREGVKFHSGKDFGVEDVLYSWAKILDPDHGTTFQALFTPIQNVEAVDDRTVKFTLSQPYAALIPNMANRRSSVILPKDFYEQNNDNIHTVADGTGPFKLVEFIAGSQLKLERNPNYYGILGGQPLPFLDGIELPFMFDEAARVGAIRSGTVDFATLISADSATLLDGDEGITVHKTPAAQVRFLTFNMRRAPFEDPRVRHAISLAVNRQEIIDQTLAGNADLTGPLPTGYGDWFIDPAQLPYPELNPDRDLEADLAQARQLLAEAGYPDGLETTVLVSSGHVVEMVNPAIVMAQQLERIGVTLTIIQEELAVYIKRLSGGEYDYDLAIGGSSFRADPDGYLYEWFHSASANNFAGVNDPAFDADLIAARQEIDQAKRREMYLAFQQKAMEPDYYLFLYGAWNFEVVRNNVQGYVPMVTTRRTTLEQTWLDR